MKSEKQKFDERQMLARAKAGNMGFCILLITLIANWGLKILFGRAWATPDAEVAVLIAPALGAYVVRCIYTGAYFNLREDDRGFKWLCAAWVALGAVAVDLRFELGGERLGDVDHRVIALREPAELLCGFGRVGDREGVQAERRETVDAVPVPHDCCPIHTSP